MTPLGMVRRRLEAQRISAATFARPEQVVAWLGAVQAQDYRGALWAVGLRLAEAREESLAELARRYFTGHGPATLADFSWWSGLKLTDARLAVQLGGERLEEETVAGQRFWFARSAPPPRTARAGVYLLPAFDEYLVGYADRSAAVDPSYLMRVNAGGGILNPTIVIGGRVVGTWKRRIERREVVFSLAPFSILTQSQTRAVTKALERYARFLGLAARREE